MGGSSGSYDPTKVRSEIRELEAKVDRGAYEAEVAQLVGEILADANSRDAEATATHLAAIKEAIEKEVDGFVDLLFGGSVSKKTYVQGISDVDTLVVINDTDLSELPPDEVRDYFIGRLQERLPDTRVEADGFAVSVKYSDGIVQLVPVKRQGDDFLLPSEDAKSWSRIRPCAFTDALSTANREQNGKIVPTIKLAKVALAGIPEGRRPSGYHLEALALEVFAGYEGPKTPKDMLTHFFSLAAQRVLHPIADRTGQSGYVDSSLGLAGSLERQILSDGLGRIARRLQNADGAHALDQWKRVLGVE
jgi:hypothetical protein